MNVSLTIWIFLHQEEAGFALEVESIYKEYVMMCVERLREKLPF